jgi:hypothetical protein
MTILAECEALRGVSPKSSSCRLEHFENSGLNGPAAFPDYVSNLAIRDLWDELPRLIASVSINDCT